MKTIGFIGGGRITKIFLHAFQKNEIDLENVVVFDTDANVLTSLKSKFPKIIVTTEDLKLAVKNDLVLIALHPPVLMETLLKIKGDLNSGSILISFAPKITIEKISFALGGFSNLARMNPSASTIVSKGVNPIAFSPSMREDVKVTIKDFFKPFGYSPEVLEPKIEAYALISAMGHTYFFFQLQKLKELAVEFGMNDKEAEVAISEMLWGTTKTLFKSGLPFNEVCDLVPVKPLAEVEDVIKNQYDKYLKPIFNRIKPE